MTTDTSLLAEFTGTLIAQGQARVQPVDPQGHMLPVLILDVRLDNNQHNHLHVEQPFERAGMHACEAAARRYTKGTRVTVQAPVAWLTLTAAHTAHIHIHQPEEATSA